MLLSFLLACKLVANQIQYDIRAGLYNCQLDRGHNNEVLVAAD